MDAEANRRGMTFQDLHDRVLRAGFLSLGKAPPLPPEPIDDDGGLRIPVPGPAYRHIKVIAKDLQISARAAIRLVVDAGIRALTDSKTVPAGVAN
jgi:hypothetical protein